MHRMGPGIAEVALQFEFSSLVEIFFPSLSLFTSDLHIVFIFLVIISANNSVIELIIKFYMDCIQKKKKLWACPT